MKLPLSLRQHDCSTDVITFGENSVDLVAVVDGHPIANSKAPLHDLTELPGGEAATAAVGLSRLGWRAKYVGRFGDDRLGAFARRHLEIERVDVADARVIPDTPNRMALIVVDRKTGDRTVLWRRDERLYLQSADLSESALAATRLLLVGSDDVEAMTEAARRAKTHDVRTVGDLEHLSADSPKLLAQLDVVIMARGFLTGLTGKSEMGGALRDAAALSGAALVCVTLEAEGCLALVDGQEVHSPAFRVEVIDTTGAGDLFRAGFIARWLMCREAADVPELLRYANAVAALGCRQVGAQTAAPTRDEVDRLLRT